MQPHFYIFFGAPGSGKSEALHFLEKKMHCVIITKESTRDRRSTDGTEIRNVKEISAKCDIRYAQYGTEYGFASTDVWKCLSGGTNAGVITNDIRTIRLLKKKYGVLARSVYIHSNVDHEAMAKLAKKRYPNKSPEEIEVDTQKRVQKIRTVHGKYIENTALFDYTILNTNSFDQLHLQLENMLDDKTLESRRSTSAVKIFIIVGASHSGKDELVTAMGQMDSRIHNYRKATSRPKRKGDNAELRHQRDGIGDKYDVQYEKNSFTYGISTKELWQSLADGTINLLVLSDQASIQAIVEIFGSVCTTLYLHANYFPLRLSEKMNDEGLSESEIGKRIQAISDLHDLYVQRMAMFDHVLLNTAEPEDLYDQAFNILDYYC